MNLLISLSGISKGPSDKGWKGRCIGTAPTKVRLEMAYLSHRRRAYRKIYLTFSSLARAFYGARAAQSQPIPECS